MKRSSSASTKTMRKLLGAVTKGNVDELTRLVKSGDADINVSDQFGWTPVHYAAYKGDIRILKILIEAGADCGAQTSKMNAGIKPGSCAMDVSQEFGHEECQAILSDWKPAAKDAHSSGNRMSMAIVVVIMCCLCIGVLIYAKQ